MQNFQEQKRISLSQKIILSIANGKVVNALTMLKIIQNNSNTRMVFVVDIPKINFGSNNNGNTKKYIKQL